MGANSLLASFFRGNKPGGTSSPQASKPSESTRLKAVLDNADAYLCRGSIRLNMGLGVTEEEVSARRDRVLRMKF